MLSDNGEPWVESHPEPGVERVLLVDDEPQVLVALEDVLGDEFRVLKTESPEQALQIVKGNDDIAVVVSDQRMPYLPGDELFARLREYSSARRILVTAYADLSAVVRAVNEGSIFAYVSKPWDPDDLKRKVAAAARQYRRARDAEAPPRSAVVISISDAAMSEP
jgi:response regulator RpfG family c-di-GMP phosphodiesterase